jgi:ribonuclease D
VLYLLEIYDRLIAQLTKLGRLTWAQDECDLLLERERGRRNPDDSWKRIKEARHLKGPARNNARALAAWRESEAAGQDVPVRRLLPDLAVVSIAQQAPKNIDALRKIRGVDGRHTKAGMAEGILQALEEASHLPPLPKPDRHKKEDSRDLRAGVTLVSAWVSQAARQFDLDPTLLGTRADIEALVRGDADARMRTGWRHEIIGGPVADLLAGKATLSFDKDGGLLLEERKG